MTIRFFQLNLPSAPEPGALAGEGRENLYRERAEAISALADCLDALETTASPAMRARRQRKIQRLISAASPHASCRRSFLKFWADPATRTKAVKIWEDVDAYLDSGGA